MSIDASETGAPISKYLYGQFLEHGGNIVNDGIWAEMLPSNDAPLRSIERIGWDETESSAVIALHWSYSPSRPDESRMPPTQPRQGNGTRHRFVSGGAGVNVVSGIVDFLQS